MKQIAKMYISHIDITLDFVVELRFDYYLLTQNNK